MKIEPQAGEVYVVDLGYAAKPRMILIVSEGAGSAPLAVVTGLSLTRQHHGTALEVALPKLPWMADQSYVNAQSLSGYKRVELGRFCGRLNEASLAPVRAALKLWLGC